MSRTPKVKYHCACVCVTAQPLCLVIGLVGARELQVTCPGSSHGYSDITGDPPDPTLSSTPRWVNSSVDNITLVPGSLVGF
ncbi:hypothetical protein FKM82_025621 [Ascaphus truei]